MKKATKQRILLFSAFLLISICAFAVFTGGGRSTAEPAATRTVRLAYLPITHALPLFAQKEMETPDGPVRIELIKYGSWPELMDALNTGRVDGASVLIELAVKAREQGIDVRAAALGHKDGNIVVTLPEIESVEDLKGKVFAIPHKQSTHKLLLDELLAAHGMTESDLTVVEMTPPEMPAALAQKRIAGYCVAEPFGAQAVVLGTGKVFARADDLWHESPCCALVFNGNFVKENGDLARETVKAYLAASESLTHHPESQAEIAGHFLKTKPIVLEKSFDWISYGDLAISEAVYEGLTARMIATGLLKTVPPYEDFVDRSLLP